MFLSQYRPNLHSRGEVYALMILFAFGASCGSPSSGAHAEAAQTAQTGLDWRASDEADVVLLAARAQSRLLQARVRDDRGTLRGQLNRLLGLRVESARSDGWGWGLSYAWDAFGDDVNNPDNTIYSYTTAAAALALLDGYELLGDTKYLDAAERAAEALLVDTCCWSDGDYMSVWYSDQANDHREDRQVHNVNGLALAALARLDEHLIPARFSDERKAMAAHLIDQQGVGYSLEPLEGTRVSRANWKYMQGTTRPNDLLHETFIVEGLLAHGTAEACEAADRSLDGVIDSHFTEEGRPQSGPYTFGSLHWGPAAALHALSMSHRHLPEARPVADYLATTINDKGQSTLAEPGETRAQAWYALGLAAFVHAERAGTANACSSRAE